MAAKVYHADKFSSRSLGRLHHHLFAGLFVSSPDNLALSIRFSQVIKTAYEQTGRGVIILIDEYDKPMLNAINDESLADQFRTILKASYGNLKSCDRYIRFAMLTGVARFSKLSFFSDINNLDDLSFEPDYSAICGITNEELDNNFSDGIQLLADKYGITPQQMRLELKRRYDGYHFTTDPVDIYNQYIGVSNPLINTNITTTKKIRNIL